MKYLFALLLLLSFNANAQSTPPPCMYLVNGHPVGQVRYKAEAVGIHVYQMCSDSKGSPPLVYGFSCPYAKCSEAVLFAAMATITRASAKVTTAHTLWKQYIEFDCPNVYKEDSPRGRLCRERNLTYLANYKAWGMP
jgi:predicted RNA-binding Zn-ribbon protein involved in translation (DUF1610 family)